MGVIAKMRGIAVHDGWKPYRSYDVAHQLCNAHHLRELEGVGVVLDQGWANEMIDLLVEAKEAVEAGEGGRVVTSSTTSALHSIRVRYGHARRQGLGRQPRARRSASATGSTRRPPTLLVRLDTQRADVLRFATDFDASWDNNQAERDVRMVKLQQKISGSWRTLAGARTLLRHPQLHLDHAQARRRRPRGPVRLFEGEVWLPAGPLTI